MQRLALAVAVAAVVASALPAPGLYLALGLGLAAIGTGWVGFAQRTASGFARLGAAAAITIGGIAVALGAVRVALVLAAIDRMHGIIG
jgi:hypothetical protein